MTLSSSIADVWFHSSKLSNITSTFRGTWSDTRSPPSTYKVKVMTTMGCKPTILIDIFRPHGDVNYDGRNIFVDMSGTKARIAYVSRRHISTMASHACLCSTTRTYIGDATIQRVCKDEEWSYDSSTFYSPFDAGVCKSVRNFASRDDYRRVSKPLHGALGGWGSSSRGQSPSDKSALIFSLAQQRPAHDKKQRKMMQAE